MIEPNLLTDFREPVTYARHFGLRAEPFALTPDPAFLYLSPGHADALAGLQVGLLGRRGLIVMTGEVGTGKTTLLYTLLKSLGTGIRTAYVANTKLSFDDLLRTALADFGLPTSGTNRAALLAELNTFLRSGVGEGTTAALIIDEAQNLDDDTFENLRLLSNFETFTEKLLQIILVGQPELEVKLQRPSLRQVAERIAVHCHVNPLSRAERRRYLAHRLEHVGGSVDLFTPAALRLLLRASEGIPRRINILAHSALLFAFGRDHRRVTYSVMRAAVRERSARGLITLRGRRPTVGETVATWLRPPLAVAPVAVAVAVVLGGLWWKNTPSAPSSQLSPVATVVEAPAQAAVPFAPDLSPQPAVATEHPVDHAADTASAQAGGQQPADAPEPKPVTAAAVPEAPAAPIARQGESLRVVRVQPGATLQSLVQDIYGRVDPALLERVAAANPQITDLDRIVAGDSLRFPGASSPQPSAKIP